jgi:hypothetical protein
VKHFRAISFLTAALAVAAIAAGTALASQSVAFKGSYAGTVTEKVNGQIVTALTKGSGSGTLVGKGSLTGTVTATTTADQPCAPLGGPGAITGPKGKVKLTLVTGSRGCAASEDDKDSITVSGNAKIAGGTLKFKHAKGTLHFSGHYNRATGSFNVKLTGKLTY